MRFRLDPWPAEYDAPVQFDDPDKPARIKVDPAVETPDWIAITPDVCPPPAICYFVDGVRRVEARVLGDENGSIVHGLFGSLASGFVCVAEGNARFGDIRVDRYLISASKEALPQEIPIGDSKLAFSGYATIDNSPVGMLAQLQSLMRESETGLAEQLAGPDACVFVDGLTYRKTSRFPVIGVIKRIVDPYLSGEKLALVESLRKGERTPMFSMEDEKNDRFSCFLRLVEPRPVEHPFAGIVRIEIGAAVGLREATRWISTAAHLLPGFASTPVRDPRAPQNLLPTGALEHEMRRRLGDALLIRRAIEKSLHEQRNW